MKTYLLLVLFLLGHVCINQALDVFRFDQDFMDAPDEDAYDDGYDFLSEGENVVSNNEVSPDWKQKGSVEEDKYSSITHFMISVDYDLKEQFGPLEYGIVGAPAKSDEDEAKGKSDDDLAIMLIGDGFAGNIMEDDKESIYQVKMVYQCFKPFSKKQVYVRLTLIDVLDEVRNITWYWYKTCGSGIREGFQVSLKEFPSDYNPDEDEQDDSQLYQTVVENGKTRKGFDFKAPEYILHSSYYPEFLFSISESYGSQAFSKPVITVSDPTILRIVAEDEASEGSIISEFTEDIRLKIVHTCLPKMDGESIVSVKVELGSFDPIEFSWIKRCSVSKQGALEISSTQGQVFSDVVKNGETLPEWNSKSPQKRILSDKSYSIFFLKSTGGSISYDHAVVTARPGHILKASVTGDGANGAVIKGDEIPLRVDYRCLQKGNATVKLTIVMSSHQHPVEISWTKECPKFQKAKIVTHENTLTANRAMFLFCFVVIVTGILGGYTWIQYKRRKIQERKARLQAQQYGGA